MALSRPDVWFGVALNRDANDPTVSPLWSNLTADLLHARGLERGRNYELDQPMAAEPELLIRDVNEYLNPANTSSPYYGQVQPYRETCMLAVWPTAGNGNLINSGTWKGNKVDSIDPSFNSYVTGAAAPNWITGINTTAIIATTAPFEGSKSLRYGVTAGATQRGVSWPIACVPGRVYTASAYVQQDSASTQVIAVQQTVAGDAFRRTSASTWTTADGPGSPGPAWTRDNGVDGDYTVSGGLGRIAISAVNSSRAVVVGTGVLDGTVYTDAIAPVTATGSYIAQGATARWADSSNHYRAYATFETNGTVGLTLARRAGAVNTTLATVVTSMTYTAGQVFRVALFFSGNVLSARVWALGASNTNTWTTGDITDATPITAAGKVGVITFLSTGNTNTLNFTVAFDNFSAEGWVVGSSTATTGSYVRLTSSFTATQPAQAVKVVTQGTAIVGTMLVDAIQHETGAAATAFTTAGAVIYPVFRNYAERFTKTWRSAGFEGFVSAPCVDAFAALNAIRLETEYTQAVLALGPDYYWRLNDGTETLQFADTSGNGRSPLVNVASKFGAGTAPVPGSTLEVVGDPGAVGVEFAYTVGGSTDKRLGTCLGAGFGAYPAASNQSLSLPASIGSAWGLTFAAWVSGASLSAGSPDTEGVIAQALGTVAGGFSRPLDMQTDGVYFQNGSTITSRLYSGGADVADGLPHFVCGTISQVSGGNTVITAYLDATSAQTTVTTAAAGGMLVTPAPAFMVGGAFFGTAFGGMLNGVVGHVAIWNRELTAAEVAGLRSAGKTAFNGETSGTRTLRHLALGGYSGPTRITTAAPATTMQPPSWVGSKDLLTDSQENTTVEQGTLWVAPDGAIVQESRQDRWLRLAPLYVLGENTAVGETPYLGTLQYDWDPMYVFADVTFARVNGTTAVGGTQADIATARRRYFPRSAAGSGDVETDQLAQYIADWIFNTHDAPMLRVAEVEIDPASNPALWPLVLSLEVGQRIQLKRRAKAANAGAGITMSADFFVEKIGIPVIDFETGVWSYRVQLSPINTGGTPTMQPWILEDATYGVLDSTTVLGF